MDRTRKAYLRYVQHLQQRDPNNKVCDFCDPEDAKIKVLADYEHFYLMSVTFPYTHWELRKVLDHRLIVPRRHIMTLSQLNPEESEELILLLGKYEQDGFDIFARTPTSTTRSFVHQHTHLIKSETKKARGVFFWRKPYILKLFR